MSDKVLIEFDDSEARRISDLASTPEMTSDEVPHFLASLAGDLSDAILRLPSEERDEFRPLLARCPDHSSQRKSTWAELSAKVVSALSRIEPGKTEARKIRLDTSEFIDDDELSKVSDSLMTRKAELYRRLAA